MRLLLLLVDVGSGGVGGGGKGIAVLAHLLNQNPGLVPCLSTPCYATEDKRAAVVAHKCE